MTAEIAILNRLAVALAADSAVSIGRPPNLKIYNTVNKIFELSGHHPVGIMVYGRLDYMGIPYEPLIKEYRRALGCTKFDHIEKYRDHFRNHLASEIGYPEIEAKRNVAAVLTEAFYETDVVINSRIRDYIIKNRAFHKSKVNGIAQEVIRERIAELKAKPYAGSFRSTKIPDLYVDVVNTLIDRHFAANAPTNQTKSLIRTYAGQLLARDHLSHYRTGIVIAGFGDKELFPSLASFETDGMIDGKLKYRDAPAIDIDRGGPHADIIGFAQEDMIKSFLDGIDPSAREFIEGLLDSGIKQVSALVAKLLLKDDGKEEAFLQATLPQIENIISKSREQISQHVGNNSANPIRDMVSSMPKQELATLASSLIEITSLKRKVSRTQETVGGEVDVAIISKSEGFVWIKRKHYFPGELNRRFLLRQDHQEEAGA